MIKMPRLLDCPRCGLLVQRGRAPGGVAWHDCERVIELTARADQQVLTMDRAVNRILTVAVDRAATLSGRELVSLVGNLGKLQDSMPREKEAADGPSGALLQFLRRDEPEDGPPVPVVSSG